MIDMPRNSGDAEIKSAAQQLSFWEPHIHSFVEICSASANKFAGTDATGDEPLADINVGVKDIIDVLGLPTRNGSAVCLNAAPATEDATIVAALRGAGANILGKTTTTEFAFTDPTDCRNPYDLRRSPGGSSSGSGAAVAAGLVEMALGTQTAGSLCRPAAYCGVVGFKPSYGILPTEGVTPLARSFDTVGIVSQSVDIAKRAFNAVTDTAPHLDERKLEVVSALLPTAIEATSETLNAFTQSSAALKLAGQEVCKTEFSSNISDIVAAHRIIMNAEAASAHRHLLTPEKIELLQPRFRAGLEAGITVTDAEYEDATDLLTRACDDFWAELAGVDIVLTLPVPEGAPLMAGTTGFQDWLTPWTVFGGPLICLPWGLDSERRPLSVMLAAFPGEDQKLLAVAERLERLAPHLPGPPLP